jgi:hypothetical protein
MLADLSHFTKLQGASPDLSSVFNIINLCSPITTRSQEFPIRRKFDTAYHPIYQLCIPYSSPRGDEKKGDKRTHVSWFKVCTKLTSNIFFD